MNHPKEKATAGTVGGVEDSGEQPTAGSYSDFPPSREVPPDLALDWARETDPLHLGWARMLRTLDAFSLVDDEHGELARRALAILSGPPIPAAVWDFAWTHSMVTAGLLYGRSPVDRARRGKLLAALFAEADAISSEIGWAA